MATATPDGIEFLRDIVGRAYSIQYGYTLLNQVSNGSAHIDLPFDIGLDQAPMRLVVDALFRFLEVKGDQTKADFAHDLFVELKGNADLRVWAANFRPDLLPLVTDAEFQAARPAYEADRQKGRIAAITLDLKAVKSKIILSADQRAIARQMLDELRAMSGYKDIHDLLHGLQQGTAAELARIADAAIPQEQRVLIVEAQRDDLAAVRVRIGQLCAEYRVLGTGPLSCDPIIAKIDAALALLRAAEGAEPRNIMLAHLRLREILRDQMPRFDEQIVRASEDIPFVAFAAMLRSLIPPGEDEREAGNAANLLTSAADSIGWLDARLETRRDVHRLWQKIDTILMMVEEVLAGSGRTLELAAHWVDLHDFFDQLARAGSEQGADDLLAAAAPIDAAAETQFSSIDTMLRMRFASFTQRARARFRAADSALLKDCQELDRLRQPVEELMDDAQ